MRVMQRSNGVPNFSVNEPESQRCGSNRTHARRSYFLFTSRPWNFFIMIHKPVWTVLEVFHDFPRQRSPLKGMNRLNVQSIYNKKFIFSESVTNTGK
jgi:hypothetical protein